LENVIKSLSEDVLKLLEKDKSVSVRKAVFQTIDQYYLGKSKKNLRKVNFETLLKRVHRNKKKTDKNHGNCALASDQEFRIVGYLRSLDIIGSPLTKPQVIALVKKLHFEKKKNWDGDSWFQLFQLRYKNMIVPKKTKQTGKSRLGEDKIGYWW